EPLRELPRREGGHAGRYLAGHRTREVTLMFARHSWKAAVLLASMAGPPAQAASPPLPVGPVVGDMDLSPFYRWPGALPAKPGVMLRQELAPAQADITSASLTQRILSTPTDLRWKAGIVSVSGTLYLPKDSAPPGGWPLVAWAHGTL